jgi:hypothetical protein
MLNDLKSKSMLFYLLIWGLISFYFGVGGVVNNQFYEEIAQIPKEEFNIQKDSATNRIKTYELKGIQYASLGDAKVAEIQVRVIDIYKWLFNSSESWILILSSCFLGVFGSIVRIIIKVIVDSPALKSPALIPILGFANGFIVLCISWSIPKFLTREQKIDLNPASILILALLAGLYYDLFIKWLKNVANSLFSSLKK